MKRLTAFLVAVALIGCSANIYMPSAESMNTISIMDYTAQLDDETAEYPDLEADCKTVTEGDFTFYVYEDFAYLTNFTDREAEEVEIPAEINGVPVIGLTDAPFGYCRKLKTIIFPDSLQYIKWEDIITTKSPISYTHSFEASSEEMSVTITEIENNTTFNPNTFNPTIINSSPVTITADEEVIYPTIEEIKVSETNPYFMVSEGLLYSKDMKKLIGCPPALDMAELKISEKAEIIGDYAFAGCYKLKNAVIPENIKQINNSAFVACEALESVELPKSINAVHMDTFYLCEALTDVKFNGDIWAIGSGAFDKCKSLTEFDIPDSVYYMGRNPFKESGCVEVKDGIHYVDNWAVDSDEDIVNAVFAEGTVGVAEWVFQMRNDIELVDFPESVTYVCDAFIIGSNDVTNTIHYRAPYINEKTLKGAKSTSDIYIYDKDCDIFDSEKTIPAEYKTNKILPDISDNGDWIVNTPTITADEETVENAVVIHGYADSSAQAYAEKYNRKFEVIEEEIPLTTTATAIDTVETTTATTTMSATTTTTTVATVETTTVTTEKPTEDIVPEIVKGDANGDGKLTIADAVSLTNWILGVSDAKLENSDAVDLCKDGKIDVFDLCVMRKELVKN